MPSTDSPPDGCAHARLRHGNSLCWYNVPRSPTLRNVHWLHIPKTGSTLARVLLRATCGAVPANRTFELFTEASSMWPIINAHCPGSFRYFESSHAPLENTPGAECGSAARQCVSMVRSPSQRVTSGFFHNLHDCAWLQRAHGLRDTMHPHEMAWQKFYASHSNLTVRLYARCVASCQSRMLTGRPCGRCSLVRNVERCISLVWREAAADGALATPDARDARARAKDEARYRSDILWHAQALRDQCVRNVDCAANKLVDHDDPYPSENLTVNAALHVLERFTFVGVQDEWNASLDAFAWQVGSHAMPMASDFVVSHKGQRPAINPELTSSTEALLRSLTFPADDAIYRAAFTRLQATLARMPSRVLQKAI